MSALLAAFCEQASSHIGSGVNTVLCRAEATAAAQQLQAAQAEATDVSVSRAQLQHELAAVEVQSQQSQAELAQAEQRVQQLQVLYFLSPACTTALSLFLYCAKQAECTACLHCLISARGAPFVVLSTCQVLNVYPTCCHNALATRSRSVILPELSSWSPELGLDRVFLRPVCILCILHGTADIGPQTVNCETYNAGFGGTAAH